MNLNGCLRNQPTQPDPLGVLRKEYRILGTLSERARESRGRPWPFTHLTHEMGDCTGRNTHRNAGAIVSGPESRLKLQAECVTFRELSGRNNQ